MPPENWHGWTLPEDWRIVREVDHTVEVTHPDTGRTFRIQRIELGPDSSLALEQDGWRLSVVADDRDPPEKQFVASFACRAGAVRALHRAVEHVGEADAAPDPAAVAHGLAVRPSAP